MSKILITGGAGFVGRWVAKNLLEKNNQVWILDNLTNSTELGVQEFRNRLTDFVIGDIKNRKLLSDLFAHKFDICVHLAASINVQDSIDNPQRCFDDNVFGTFNILEECRKHKTKFIFVSSALIYKTVKPQERIKEDYPLASSCPYVVSKIFGEGLTISYYNSYHLPVVILRPFSVYGPWQRSDSEGGVMSIFIDRELKVKPIEIFGDGQQGRDFFYIEDCAEFIARSAFSKNAVGEIFNAGSGEEIKIRALAELIANKKVAIKFIKHPHPHAEIMDMCADSTKAETILGWKAKTTLEEGINKTRGWLEARQSSSITVDK